MSDVDLPSRVRTCYGKGMFPKTFSVNAITSSVPFGFKWDGTLGYLFVCLFVGMFVKGVCLLFCLFVC